MVKVDMTDEKFEARTGKWFDEGEFEVIITKAERGVTDAGKEYVEFTVLGQEDQETNARLWFSTDKAAKYALSIMGGIVVHNQETDAQKDKARESFRAITDTDQIDDKFLKKFEKKDAFIQVYEDTDGQQKPNGGFYKRANIYGYPPSPRKQTAEQIMSSAQPISNDEVPFE